MSTQFTALDNEPCTGDPIKHGVMTKGGAVMSINSGSDAGWSILVQKPIATGGIQSGGTTHCVVAVFTNSNPGSSTTLIVDADRETSFVGQPL